jgi:hypothetical protein
MLTDELFGIEENKKSLADQLEVNNSLTDQLFSESDVKDSVITPDQESIPTPAQSLNQNTKESTDDVDYENSYFGNVIKAASDRSNFDRMKDGMVDGDIITDKPIIPTRTMIPTIGQGKFEKSIFHKSADFIGNLIGADPDESISEEAKAKSFIEYMAMKDNIPLHEYRQSPEFMEKAASGFVDVASFGLIPNLRREVNGEIEFEPTNFEGYAGKAIGSLAGFIFGPVSASKAILKPVLLRIPKVSREAKLTYRIATEAIKEGLVLGAASGAGSLGEASTKTTFTESADTIWESTKSGALTGVIFGTSRGLFPKDGVDIGKRLITGLIGLNALRAKEIGGNPFTDRPPEEVIFDIALDAFFLYKGMPTEKAVKLANTLDKIARESKDVEAAIKAIEKIRKSQKDQRDLTLEQALKKFEKYLKPEEIEDLGRKAEEVSREEIYPVSKTNTIADGKRVTIREEISKDSNPEYTFTAQSGNEYKKVAGKWYDKNGKLVTNNFVIKAAEKRKVKVEQEVNESTDSTDQLIVELEKRYKKSIGEITDEEVEIYIVEKEMGKGSKVDWFGEGKESKPVENKVEPKPESKSKPESTKPKVLKRKKGETKSKQVDSKNKSTEIKDEQVESTEPAEVKVSKFRQEDPKVTKNTLDNAAPYSKIDNVDSLIGRMEAEVNGWLDGRNVDIEATKSIIKALNDASSRWVEGTEMPFAFFAHMSDAERINFSEYMNDLNNWAQSAKRPSKGTRLNMMIPVDEIPNLVIDVLTATNKGIKKLGAYFSRNKGEMKTEGLYRNKEIFNKTGFWLGQDGKWRYEVSDKDIKFKEDKEQLLNIHKLEGFHQAKLSDIIDHPELFEAFPELKDVNVTRNYPTFTFGPDLINASGWYDPRTNTINLVPRKGTISTMVHEIQHALQDAVDGVIRGGTAHNVIGELSESELSKYADKVASNLIEEQSFISAEMYLAKVYDKKINKISRMRYGKINKLLDELAELETRNNITSHLTDAGSLRDRTERLNRIKEINSKLSEITDLNSNELLVFTSNDSMNRAIARSRQSISEMKNIIKESVDELDVLESKQADRKKIEKVILRDGRVRDEIYLSIAGEMEARLSSTRKEMTDAERRNEPPWETLDIMLGDEGLSKSTGYKLYDIGGATAEAVKQAYELANRGKKYMEDAKGMKKFKSKIAARRAKEFLKREFVDRMGNIRTGLIDLGADGYEAVKKAYLSKGSSSMAALKLKHMQKDVYGGLSRKNKDVLDRIIFHNRMIDIGKYKTQSQFRYFQKHALEESVAYIELVGQVEKLSPETVADLNKRAVKYTDWMKSALEDMHKEGLITDKEFENLSKHNYRKVKLVDIVDDVQRKGIGKGKRTVYDSGIESLSRGRDTDIFEPSSEVMALEVFNRAYGRIMNNRANLALLELAKNNPDNPFARIAGEDRDPIPSGWQEIYVVENGKRKTIHISPDMAKEWITRDPSMKYEHAQLIRYLSGSPILRTFATGANWGFALANLPRDVMHAWYSAGTMIDGKWKPIYSSHAPIYGLQIGRDLTSTFTDALLRKGRYLDYINEGGGMEFMVHQGRILQRGRHLEGNIDKINNFFGFFGETTEIMTRLAIRERAIRRGMSPEDATLVARDYMDFGQGGGFTKVMDNGIPYLNASIQGTRGMFRAFKESPWKSSYKLAQFATIVTGLYIAMDEHAPKTKKELQGNLDMTNNLVIPLGDEFGFLDDKGQMRYPYIKIPLDPSQRFFKKFFEASTDKWLGNEVDAEGTAAALKGLMPVEDASGLLPPTISSTLGYASNKNFWMNEEIFRNEQPFSWPNSKYEYTENTPQVYKDFGNATGLSPERSRYAVREIVAGDTMWSYLLGKGYDELLGDLPKEKKSQHLAMVLARTPISKRFIGVTNPYTKHGDKIDKAQEEAIIKTYVENTNFDIVVDAYLYGKEGVVTRNDVINEAKKYKDKEVYDRLIDRFKFEEGIKDLPERSFWSRMKGLRTEAKAKIFVDRLKSSNQEEEKQLWKEYGIISRAGGIVSSEFRSEVYKLMEVN